MRRLLPLHVGGDLPAFLGRAVGGHARRCPRCAEELGSLRAARRPLQALAAAEDRPGAAPEGLGENFWLAIRRDLRTEGLVRGHGREGAAGPEEARRARAARRSTAWGLGGRAFAAAVAAILAALIFFPKETAPPGSGDLPLAETDGGRAVEKVVAGTVSLPEPPPRLFPQPLPGVTVVPAAVRGWIEETRSFTPPGVEFGLERWRHGDRRLDDDRTEDVELLSF